MRVFTVCNWERKTSVEVISARSTLRERRIFVVAAPFGLWMNDYWSPRAALLARMSKRRCLGRNALAVPLNASMPLTYKGFRCTRASQKARGVLLARGFRMTEHLCRDLRCSRYEMTQLEFRRLRGELWDQSFIARLGKAASKLYREIYGKKPRLKYSWKASRNHVHFYPCGILEQAYAQLVEQGVPLVKPQSELARRIEKHGQVSPRPKDDC